LINKPISNPTSKPMNKPLMSNRLMIKFLTSKPQKWSQRFLSFSLALASFALPLAGVFVTGCKAPGEPGPAEERPDQVRNFAVLYKQNCAACHGEQGRAGIATSMANPTYIAFAGHDAIAKAIREGGPGDLMPAFGQKHGGFLTDEQVEMITSGILHTWGHGATSLGATAPAYAATLEGNAAEGKQLFVAHCARCHQDGARPATAGATAQLRNVGSITDPDFLALISDQNLRTTILTGKPDEAMPDWRGYGPQPLTDQQVTDLVAWLGSQRRANRAAPAQAAGRAEAASAAKPEKEKTQGEKQ